LVDTVQQLQRSVCKAPVPFLWLNPNCKELCCEVAGPRRCKVEHARTQRIAEVPGLIHESLRSICVPIDYESICVNIGWIIRHDKSLSLWLQSLIVATRHVRSTSLTSSFQSAAGTLLMRPLLAKQPMNTTLLRQSASNIRRGDIWQPDLIRLKQQIVLLTRQLRALGGKRRTKLLSSASIMKQWKARNGLRIGFTTMNPKIQEHRFSQSNPLYKFVNWELHSNS